MEPTSSWILVGFVSTEPQQELPNLYSFLSGLHFAGYRVVASLASGICLFGVKLIEGLAVGFPVGGTGASPLVGEAESYPSGG